MPGKQPCARKVAKATEAESAAKPKKSAANDRRSCEATKKAGKEM